MKVLIIIPAYNEESNIVGVIENIRNSYSQYDYVVINDCSNDTTWRILRENNYNYVSLPINLGIGGAVQCGYMFAAEHDYDVAIQLDGDAQHDPAYIAELLKPLSNGEADMVVGSRFITNEGFQTTAMRRFGIQLIKIAIKLCCGAQVTDTTSGFRAVNKGLIKLFAQDYAQDYPEPEAIVTAVLNGYRVTEVPVVMRARGGGVSSIDAKRSAYYMLKVPLALLVYRMGIKRMKRKG